MNPTFAPIRIKLEGLTHAGKIYQADEIEPRPTPHLLELAQAGELAQFVEPPAPEVRVPPSQPAAVATAQAPMGNHPEIPESSAPHPSEVPNSSEQRETSEPDEDKGVCSTHTPGQFGGAAELALSMHRDGCSLRQIGTALESEGFPPPPRARKWSASTVRRLLQRNARD